MSGSVSVMPAMQPMGGGMPYSPLAAAMMNRMASGVPQSSNPVGGIPLGTLAMLMQQGGGGLGNGIGNLLSGYQWNGMPGQGMMNDLSQQAAQNAGNMGPGGPTTDPYGSMGGAYNNRGPV